MLDQPLENDNRTQLLSMRHACELQRSVITTQ